MARCVSLGVCVSVCLCACVRACVTVSAGVLVGVRLCSCCACVRACVSSSLNACGTSVQCAFSRATGAHSPNPVIVRVHGHDLLESIEMIS